VLAIGIFGGTALAATTERVRYGRITGLQSGAGAVEESPIPWGSGAIALTQDHAFLLAVNAGSGDISVFRVRWTMLSHGDKVPCGGSEPVAIGQHRDLVYVVKAGGSSNLKRQSSRLCS